MSSGYIDHNHTNYTLNSTYIEPKILSWVLSSVIPAVVPTLNLIIAAMGTLFSQGCGSVAGCSCNTQSATLNIANQNVPVSDMPLCLALSVGHDCLQNTQCNSATCLNTQCAQPSLQTITDTMGTDYSLECGSRLGCSCFSTEAPLTFIPGFQPLEVNLPLCDGLSTGDRCRKNDQCKTCLLYTSPSPRDRQKSRMPSSA